MFLLKNKTLIIALLLRIDNNSFYLVYAKFNITCHRSKLKSTCFRDQTSTGDRKILVIFLAYLNIEKRIFRLGLRIMEMVFGLIGHILHRDDNSNISCYKSS